MLKELIVSVISGIIVAMILQIFPSRARSESQPPMRKPIAPQPAAQRGSSIGGLMRFIVSVAGGMGLAYTVAHSLHLRHLGHGDDIASHAPMLVLTIIGTFIVWLLLSAMTRR
jgi:hypothetical protein